jgi:DNA-binding LacI/PurR family transcriptional regulator
VDARPTLETVAARAGVSRSLVSLVLRGSPSVSAGRREAVLRAVAELGYRPNAAARVLAERKSNTVGVLLNDLRQPWFADMLDGLTPGLHAGGKAILLGDGRLDRMMDEPLSWSFLGLGVDGLVLAGSSPVTATISNVAGQIPTVAVGGTDPDLPHVDVLASDNHLGGTLAVGTCSDSGTGGSRTSPGCRARRAACGCRPTRTRCARPGSAARSGSRPRT